MHEYHTLCDCIAHCSIGKCIAQVMIAHFLVLFSEKNCFCDWKNSGIIEIVEMYCGGIVLIH